MKKSNRPNNAFLNILKKTDRLFMIGEIKKASPSKGDIAPNIDVEAVADVYNVAEIDAISVLTEERYFKGSAKDLISVRKRTDKPILRKDFIFDPYQIYEAKAIGADCVLLIVAMLSEDRLRELIDVATSINIDTLVEVHDEYEAEIAQRVNAKIIGINNRNLKDFTVDIKNTQRVKSVISKDCFVISESGIHKREDIEYLESIGVDGVLIGESIVSSKDIVKKVRELRGYGRG